MTNEFVNPRDSEGKTLAAESASAPHLVSSPLSTGGAGERFEQYVGAHALALLLVRSTPPILLDSVVTEVRFQTRHFGWNTDDILLVGNVSPTITRKLAIQVKRTFTVSRSDEECAKTFCGMWDDFTSADRFDPSLDRFAIATLRGTSTLLGDFDALLTTARATSTAAEFVRRLNLTGHVSQKTRSQDLVLRNILRDHQGGQLNEERYWTFLRVLTVLSFDFGTATAQTEAMTLALLAHTISVTGEPLTLARATWNELLTVASESKATAATCRRESLPKRLIEVHCVVPTADERALQALVAHGKTVRDTIRSQIGRIHTAERIELAESASRSLENDRVVVLVGSAGSGKSGLAKGILARIEHDRPVLAFQAVEFAVASINETLGKTQSTINSDDLFALLASHDKVTILIDGVERLLEHPVRDAFSQFILLASQSSSFRLVLTCRDYSLETVRSALLDPFDVQHSVIQVGPFSDEEIDSVARDVPSLAFALSDSRMKSFLRTPYLLDMASRIDWSVGSLPENTRSFQERCWQSLIRDDASIGLGLPQRREKVFTAIARERASALRPFVKCEIDDPAAISALVEDSLIERSAESENLYAPAHDVLEDWAVLRWLDEIWSHGNDRPLDLANAVAGLPALRRGLRRWLGDRLETDPAETTALLIELITRDDLPQYFRDDCIVAALLSRSVCAFLDGCRSRIDMGDASLLSQIIHLLRVACKTTPWWLPRAIASTLLVPDGAAWGAVLNFVAQHVPFTENSHAILFLGLLEDWAQQVAINQPAPDGADAAGKLATSLMPFFSPEWRGNNLERLLKVILKIPERVRVYEDLTKRALVNDRSDRVATDFAALSMSTFSSAFVCRHDPAFVIELLRRRLTIDESRIRDHDDYRSPIGVDECFGMHRFGVNDFFPASALQGPFRALFQHHPVKALDFVIEISNRAATWYGERKWPGNDLEPAEQLWIDVPGYGKTEQWFVGRLYGLYRGMTVGPYALQSALMAMEEWLLRIAEWEEVDLDRWLLYVLGRGNSALTTAVVTSVCIAHPSRAIQTALALLSTRELFDYDRSRVAAEGLHSMDFLTGLNPRHDLYESERKSSNALPHRPKDLETVALTLQLSEHKDSVWALLDRHREMLGCDADADDSFWRIALHRMDLRRYTASVAGVKSGAPEGAVETPGPPSPSPTTTRSEAARTSPPDSATSAESDKQCVYLIPEKLEPKLQAIADESGKRLEEVNKHLSLRMTAQKAWESRGGPEGLRWAELLREAKELSERDPSMDSFARGGPGLVAAVCLRDQIGVLSQSDLNWCVNEVSRQLQVRDSADEMYVHGRLFGPDRAAAAVAPLIVAAVPSTIAGDAAEFLIDALTHPIYEVSEYAYSGAAAFLSPSNDSLALRCAAAAAREATVLTTLESGKLREQLGQAPSKLDGDAVRAAMHSIITGGLEEAIQALSQLDVNTWQGRSAALRIWPILISQSEIPVVRDLVGRTAEWLGHTWSSAGRSRNRVERHYEMEHSLSRLIGRFVLKLQDEAALDICAPVIAVTETQPREAATFLWHLIIEADGGALGDSFWAIWQAFADTAVAAPWAAHLERERLGEESMVHRLFLRVSWKPGTKDWARLQGNTFRIHGLASRLLATPIVLEEYLHFLFDIGRKELPGALLHIHALVQRANKPASLLTSESTFVLESLFGEFVYAHPLQLKSDDVLRSAVLALLDYLVVHGSSAAYRMRDDFVTPIRG
jgi:hypothetical protein